MGKKSQQKGTTLLLKPPRLQVGGTIGVIALSSPCRPNLLEAGIKHIQALGFKTKVALSPAAAYGKSDHLFSSDSAAARVRGLEELFEDPEVGAVIAVRGAYGSMEILPHIKHGKLSATPKIVAGFSDMTAVLLALYQSGGLTAIHGPMVAGAFANAHNHSHHQRSVDALLAMLRGELSNPFQGLTFEGLGKVKDGQGVLVGGSLTTLISLLGTPWEIDTTDKILFLEDVGEKPYAVARMLMQLKLAGKLDALGGLLLGDFKDCGAPEGPTVKEVFSSYFTGAAYPVLWGLPFGHDTVNLPLPLGVSARIHENTLEVLEAPVV